MLKIKIFWECYAVSVGKQLQMFGRIVVPSSWRWNQYNPLKQQELLSQTQSITSQKTSNFSSTVMRTSNLTYSLLFVEYMLL